MLNLEDTVRLISIQNTYSLGNGSRVRLGNLMIDLTQHSPVCAKEDDYKGKLFKVTIEELRPTEE